ncbi:MAG: 4-hydroxythreonine-4-phosphate dehydrogenase PdxA [Xanthomonadales bacterium]|nr:4-hydroxythreonine-4-phosphate dehydrogenase PdxA [Xanthomonadales bacterium]
MTDAVARIAVTAGEPAGIGPELLVRLAQAAHPAQLVAIADPTVLLQAADALDIPLLLQAFDGGAPAVAHAPGRLWVQAVPTARPVHFGCLDLANAGTVIETLRAAAEGAEQRRFDAIVTAPVQKSVLNDAGFAFSGHTEFFADRVACDVVMMLVAGELRVALATTHLPLRAVPDAIRADRLERTIRILHADLGDKFAFAAPRITVLGLNPHAGEGGHLGREELDVIAPVLERLRSEGMVLRGPLPADTAFLPRELAHCDAVLAMYHDQGLPVLKHAGFGHAVNITLGLPYIRTSVDHGTALDLAGCGVADAGSLFAATALAIELVARRRASMPA